jgi:hypothetical protein
VKKISYLVLLSILIIISFNDFNSVFAQDDLSQCISSLSGELNRSIGDSKIAQIIGYKMIVADNNTWIVLNIRPINYLFIDEEIFCSKIKGKWEIVDFDPSVLPESVVKFYVDYLYSRNPKFVPMSSPIFIGDKSSEILRRSKTNVLQYDLLSWYSDLSLELMANEIIARHGATFTTQFLNDFFHSRTWYQPNMKFKLSSLSAVERKNLDIINECRKNLKSQDYRVIVSTFFGKANFQQRRLGDINSDGMEEVLLYSEHKKNYYDKTMVLGVSKKGQYFCLLKIGPMGIFGKDQELLIPFEQKLVWKIKINSSGIVISPFVTDTKECTDEIFLSWSKTDKEYFMESYI